MLKSIIKNDAIKSKLISLLLIILIVYSLLHFAYGGIYFPLKYANLSHTFEEIGPLIKFLQGNEFISTNPRQYGPGYILIMLPFMMLYDNQTLFYLALLLFDYILMGFAFYLCYKYIFYDKPKKKRSFLILLILWLNFVPLMCSLAMKAVEIWELCLIIFGFVFFIKKKYIQTGFTFAAGMLIKFLPGLFIFYFLFKKTRIFFFSIISTFIITAITHIAIGGNIGFSYFVLIFDKLLRGKIEGKLLWELFYEDSSLRGFVYKLLGGFKQKINAEPPIAKLFFTISAPAENIAYLLTIVLTASLLFYLIIISLRKNCSKEEVMVQFSIVSVLMLIISTSSVLEYGTLLLLAYSVGIYFILFKPIPKYLYLLYGASYFLIGNFIPLSIIIRILPIEKLASIFNITGLVTAQMYRTFGFPLFGNLCLLIFFILIWHNKKIFKTEKNEEKERAQ